MKIMKGAIENNTFANAKRTDKRTTYDIMTRYKEDKNKSVLRDEK